MINNNIKERKGGEMKIEPEVYPIVRTGICSE